MEFKLFLFLSVLICLFEREGSGQVRTFSAKEVVQFAIENSPAVKNAKIDIDIAKAKVSETTSAGLPQVSGKASVLHYPEVQRFVLENTPNSAFYTPALKDNAPVAFGLQLANSISGDISASQLIFNGSYLVGLKASKTYQELSGKQLKQAKITLAEQVLKTYYSILVNQDQNLLGK